MMMYSVAAGAQNTATTQGNFIVYSIHSISITNNSGIISFNTPNDYFNGVIANNYANIRVKCNSSWVLSFSAQSTYFNPLTKGGSTDMPASVIGIRKSGQSNFKPLSTQGQTLVTGSKGGGTGNHDFDIDVNFNPGFKYSGGLYSIGIMYTLTKQ